MNIALLSPNENAFSESFIQVHRERLKGNVFYYFSGELPSKIENGVVINSRRKRIIDIFKGHFKLNRYSLAEQALITSFRKNEINIVFAEYGVTGERILPVCKELDLPLIVHFHGYDAARKDILEDNDHYQGIFDYAKYIVVVSKKMHADFVTMGCPAEKLVYNVCGPREEFLQIEPLFSKQQFIAIGRFVNKKAPYYLILSFLEVVQLFPEAKLVIAGEGELWNSCKNLVRFYGLEKNISFPGVISSEGFQKYLEESLALVQHSITADDGDAEGTPVSILEASAAGLPVLSTWHAGIPDVIVHEKTGLLVKEHDVEGMAQHMIKFLNEKSYARELGANGKRNIEDNFTLKKHIGILDKLIQEAVDK